MGRSGLWVQSRGAAVPLETQNQRSRHCIAGHGIAGSVRSLTAPIGHSEAFLGRLFTPDFPLFILIHLSFQACNDMHFYLNHQLLK